MFDFENKVIFCVVLFTGQHHIIISIMFRLPAVCKSVTPLCNAARLSTSGVVGREAGEAGWLSKLWVRKIEPTNEPHSRMLSDKDVIYALHTHNIKPDSVGKYLDNYRTTVQFIESKKTDIAQELVASWTVQVGDMDQVLHLWRYTGGFEAIDQAKDNLWHDPDYLRLMAERGTYLRSRHLQYLLMFSYWPQPLPRTDRSHIYEMRSYRLKPGTMIEWANNWARAINFRKSNNEAYAGFFSQIGRLYNVHHIWCKNLAIL